MAGRIDLPKRERLTDARKRAFLEALRIYGAAARAAREASPSAKGKVVISTFKDERRRNPEFAQARDDALEAHHGDFLAELYRRAMTGDQVPIQNAKGEVIGGRSLRSDKLLLDAVRGHHAAFTPRTQTVEGRLGPPGVERLLQARHDSGQPIFTGAFMVNGPQNRPKLPAVPDYIDWCYRNLDADEVARTCTTKRAMFECIKHAWAAHNPAIEKTVEPSTAGVRRRIVSTDERSRQDIRERLHGLHSPHGTLDLQHQRHPGRMRRPPGGNRRRRDTRALHPPHGRGRGDAVGPRHLRDDGELLAGGRPRRRGGAAGDA